MFKFFKKVQVHFHQFNQLCPNVILMYSIHHKTSQPQENHVNRWDWVETCKGACKGACKEYGSARYNGINQTM